MLLHIVIIIILFIITYSRNIIKKVHTLLDFYNDNYFPIKEYLSKKGSEYVPELFITELIKENLLLFCKAANNDMIKQYYLGIWKKL